MLKLLFYILFPFIISAQSIENKNNPPSYSSLFHNFGNNLLHSFTNSYGLYHISAIVSSYGLVEGGVDWWYYDKMRDNKSIGYTSFPSVLVGGLVPLAVPLYLYFKSNSNKDAELMYTSLALGQAVIISYITSSGYKAITGRDGPRIFDDNGKRSDYSKNFHFGFFENGIFDGWPSGHTTTAAAMAATLMELYPNNSTIETGAIIYAAYVGIGITTNIHWFSDFVAGTLIGYSIGKTVGQSFRNLMDNNTNQENFSIFPTLNGFRLRYIF
jgi:hypothetical protein